MEDYPKFPTDQLPNYFPNTDEDVNSHPDVTNPVLTGDDVTDVNTDFVADPFIVPKQDGKGYWMFFEGLESSNNEGFIAVASSDDGLNWSYEQSVIRTNVHHSYPCVFREDGQWYMATANQDVELKLYTTSDLDFPFNWSLANTSLTNVNGIFDPTPIKRNNRWYLIYGNRNDKTKTYIHYSNEGDSLENATWNAHPNNPVISSRGTPCGRPIVKDNGNFVFYLKDEPAENVRAVEVTDLTTSNFSFQTVNNDEFILDSDSSWQVNHMHHIDPVHENHQNDLGLDWIAVVDGKNPREWEIGIYYRQHEAGKTKASKSSGETYTNENGVKLTV